MPQMNHFWAVLFVVTVSSFTLAQGFPYTPKQGSAERKAIMDALRIPVEKKLTQEVIFKVNHLKVEKEWAFLRAVPQQPNGKPINYKDTEYRRPVEEGSFDDAICALLHKQGNEWRVVTYDIGATDVAYEGWDRKHHAPTAIFK